MNVLSTIPSLSRASTVAFHEYFPNSQYFVSSTGGGGASNAEERAGRFFREAETRGANKNLTTVAITVLRFCIFKFLKKNRTLNKLWNLGELSIRFWVRQVNRI